MKKLFEKYAILQYIVSTYVKTLLLSIGMLTVVFVIMHFSGLYVRLENALNLKYNSPFVIVPLFTFAALGLLCLFIGFLLYFYKYKRSKSKSVFYNTFSNILNRK